MAVLLLAVCLISQLRLAGRERQRRAAQQNSLEQLLAAAPEGILCMRGTVDTCSTTKESTSVVLRALAVEKNEIWLRLDVPAHGAGCTIKKNEEALLPGDEIEIRGTLRIPEEAGNPGAFDAKTYYSRLDIVCQLTEGKLLSKKSGPDGIRPFLYQIRRALCASLASILPEKEAGSMMAIALGEKRGMDPDIKALYQESGITHIISVSGVKTLKLDIPLVPETRIKWALMPLHIAKIYILKLCLDEEIIPRCRFPCSRGYLTKCINQQKKQ